MNAGDLITGAKPRPSAASMHVPLPAPGTGNGPNVVCGTPDRTRTCNLRLSLPATAFAAPATRLRFEGTKGGHGDTGLGSGLYLHHRRWDTYSLYGSRCIANPAGCGTGQRRKPRFPRYCHRHDALRFHRYSVLHSGRSSFRQEAPCGGLSRRNNRRVTVRHRSKAVALSS